MPPAREPSAGVSDPLLATPRSAIENLAWPALLTEGNARQLALQFQLDESQWWSAEDLRAWQFRQLSRLVAHAVKTVPYYRSRLEGIPDLGARDLEPALWARLPVLDRRAVQANLEALTSSASPPPHGAVTTWTAGPPAAEPVQFRTNEMVRFYENAFALREEIWRRRQWRAKRASIAPEPAGLARYPEGRRESDWGGLLASLYETGPAVYLDDGTALADQAHWLLREAPAYLTTGAGNAVALARHFRAAGLDLPSLKGVAVTGAALTSEGRSECRAAWHVEPAEIYSADEIGPIALQCPAEPALHVQSEAVLLEVLDAAGQPCAPGTPGRVVVTPLHNFSMPLLRYALGDLAAWGPPCPCGRGLPVLSRIPARQ